jgi:signal transduction histidine kinase
VLILTLTTSLFILLTLGFFVLVSAPHRQINRVFAAFTLAMILWIVKDLLFWGFADGQTSPDGWVKSSFLIGILLQLTFLYFTDLFPENEPPPRRKFVLVLIPVLLLMPTVMNGWLWHSIEFEGGRFRIDLSWWAYLFGIVNYLILGAGVGRLVRKERRYRGTIWGTQIRLILLSVLLTASLLFIGDNLLPMLGWYGLLPYSSVFIVIGALIYTYAISSFNLFSLPTALDQLRLFPLTYKLAIVIAGTGLLGFVAVQLPIAYWTIGSGNSSWTKFIVLSAIAGTVPSLVLVLLIGRLLSKPLRDLTEMALDVSRGNYGAESRLTTNDELGVLASSFNTMSRKMADDIARLKEINQVMVRTEKLATAGALATSVAHEVNNPLASISSLVQSLLIRETEERNRETLRIIFSQITRISAVLRDLMEFARPKQPEPRPTDLNQVIRKSLELAGYDKRFKRMRIEKSFDGSLPHLWLDGDRLQQVVLNLLLNARDAIGEERRDGVIAINTGRSGDTIVVEIIDNGTGISEKDLPFIFDPFFTTKAKSQGTGLGLSVCLNIVTALGGTIAGANRESGSVFTITFPFVKKES